MAIQDDQYPKNRPTPGYPNPKNYGPGNNKISSAGSSHHCFPKRSASSGSGIKYLLYPLLVLTTLWYGADRILDKLRHRVVATPQSLARQDSLEDQAPVEMIPGGAILKTDRNGHFRGTALINDVEVPFLVDTGATQTVIPEKIAQTVGLEFGKTIQKNTAGGRVTDHLTRIDSLKIGNAELKNISASINQHLEEVLLGMNTLKYFRMTQEGNKLTLVASGNQQDIDEIEKGIPFVPAAKTMEKTDFRMPAETAVVEQEEPKTKSTWKKSVVCDGQKNCKTVYGDR